MDTIRIGVLGAANIAKRSIIPELKNLSDRYTVAGVASRNKEKAIRVASEFDVTPYFSYNELINPDLVDALYIPLPNALHYEYAKQALQQGIHVLVEKSLGCNFKEVNELVEIAKAQNVLLMENFQFRFHSQLQYLRDTIDSKQIGDLRGLNVAFCFPPFPDKDNIRYNKELGGGALLDAGAYTTKVSSLLLGNDLSVEAATLNSGDDYEVDIWGSAFLKHKKSGINAALTFGFDHFYQCGVQVLGSKGKITTNRLFTAREDYVPMVEIDLNGQQKKIIKLATDNHFRNMLIHFHKSITNEKAKENENIQNIEQALLIEAIKTKANV